MDFKDQISKVDSPGTNQLAFSAKHALFDLIFQVEGFTSEEQQMQSADVEIHEMSCSAGSGTTATGHATKDCRLDLNQVIPDRFIIPVIIDLTVLIDGVAEGFHDPMRLRLDWGSGR